MQTTRRTPPTVPGNAARRILAGALGALRGDKYMVGAYPSPPAGGSHDGIGQDSAVDSDGPSRSGDADGAMPLHFARPISRDEER